MTGILDINLGGKIHRLRFNNFSRMEIAKRLVKGDGLPHPESFIKAVDEMASDNHLLLMKIIIYAGICGESYIKSDKPALTIEEIGEIVATEDAETLFKAWRAFLDAEGINLPVEEKKPTPPKKKRRR